MIPIVDFCWQNFNPVEIWNLSVRELVDLAGRHDPKDPFVVVYNKQYHLPILVFDDVVAQLAESLKLPPDASALTTGLLDLLKQGQVTVRENEPASRVAWLAIEHDIEVVTAANDDAIPVGLFIPSIVTERLPKTTKLQQCSPHLQETIGRLTKVDDLPWAIMALEGELNQYGSERLKGQDIRRFQCQDHGKPHYIFRPKCENHPTAKVI